MGVAHKGMAIPLFWYLLDKKGNSNYRERSKIIEDFIEVFGLEKIEVLVADREFTGKEWFKWLIKDIQNREVSGPLGNGTSEENPKSEAKRGHSL